MARLTVEALENVEADYILSSNASCAVAMAQDYPYLFRNDGEWLERARRVADRVIDFSGFMERVARLPSGSLRNSAPEIKVTYHDACQTNNALGVTAEQRRLIHDVMGLELVEMNDSEFCCGFGGSFTFDHPEVSGRLLRRKLGNALETGANAIVSDNPGCLMHLRGGLKALDSRVEVLHLAELMARRLPA